MPPKPRAHGRTSLPGYSRHGRLVTSPPRPWQSLPGASPQGHPLGLDFHLGLEDWLSLSPTSLLASRLLPPRGSSHQNLSKLQSGSCLSPAYSISGAPSSLSYKFQASVVQGMKHFLTQPLPMYLETTPSHALPAPHQPPSALHRTGSLASHSQKGPVLCPVSLCTPHTVSAAECSLSCFIQLTPDTFQTQEPPPPESLPAALSASQSGGPS